MGNDKPAPVEIWSATFITLVTSLPRPSPHMAEVLKENV